MGKKAIFLDIDGTLTEPGSNTPPDSALKAVKMARQKGNYVFLCTGRNRGMLKPLLQYGFDGFVGSAGGYVECQGKLIFGCPMESEQREKVFSVLERNGIYRTVECLDDSYTDESFKDFIAEKCSESGNSELLRWRKQIEESLNIRPMSEYGGEPVYKVVVMSPGMEQIRSAEKELKEDFVFCIQDADKYGIVNGEIVNRSFDKGKGVKRVCEHLGIPLSDSVGFGDSMNDKEMMEVVGLSVCMKNGSETMKKMADKICDSVTEDGLWKAFEEYGLV